MTDTVEAPLAGLRVLDLTRVIAGPTCAMVLGDLGAEVVKVEDPRGGDSVRQMGGFREGFSLYFQALNRRKQSVTLDLANPEGQRIARALALASDVLIENYVADALDKYGLGYQALSEAHPGLVYCSISGYGKTGPDRQRAGYDQAIQAEIGVMSVNGEPGSEPTRLPVSYQDVITGLYAANSVQAALRVRERTGRGQWIDLSLIDCGLSAFLNYAGDTLGGVPTRRWGNAALASPVNAYRTRDDGRIMMIVGSDFQFRRFLEAAGREELMEDPRFVTIKARMANQELVEKTVADIFLADDRDAWMEKLRAKSVPAGPVRSVEEGMASPEVRARGMIHRIDHPVMGEVEVVGSPIRLSETPVPPPTPAPVLGADTDAVMARMLDMDAAAIAAARDAGAFG